jgi:hypothetical protein
VIAIAAGALDHPGIVLLMKAAAGCAPITVVAPDPGPAIRLRFVESGIHLIELPGTLKPTAYGIDVLDSGMLEPQAGVLRLSIQVRTQAVQIDGTPQRVPAQPFKLLALLAQEVRDGAGPVRNRAIEDATGRDARDLVRELRDAISAGRPNAAELRDWIEARRSLGAFELALAPEQIKIQQ